MEAPIAALLEALASDSAPVKYGANKRLIRLSAESPERLYAHFDVFMRLLEGDNTFLRWGAARILGNLAAADTENRLEPVLDRFLAPISGHELIGAANAIVAAADIVLAKPHLADRVAGEILKVRRASYKTAECRNVAIGHAIRSFDRFFPHIRNQKPVLAFVKRQLGNSRAATRRKAERFLKRWSG